MVEENCSAKYLTEGEIEEVKKSFKIFDADDSGSISIRVNARFSSGIRSNSQIFGPKSFRIGIVKLDPSH
jgi:hypothetical protein